MPTMITHMVIAEKLFKKHFAKGERKKFFLGTGFPDIGNWCLMPREATHAWGLQITQIAKQESFMAGFQLHSLVDEIHYHYYKKHFPQFSPDWILNYTAYKLVEDGFLHQEVGIWDEVIGYYNGLIDEERSFPVADSCITKWHDYHRRYFSSGFTLDCIEEYCANSGNSKEDIRKLKDRVNTLKVDAKIRRLVKLFQGNIKKRI